MAAFDYGDYLSFLGGKEDGGRQQKLSALLPHLPGKEGLFWNQHSHMVEKGILYQGAIEKMCMRLATLLGLLRGKKIQQLFAMKTIDEQRAFVKDVWNSFLWRKSFDLLFNYPLMRFALKDPGTFAFLGQAISPGSYLYNRMTHSLNSMLAAENPLISLILRGKVDPAAYPPYLKPEGVTIIKSRLEKLSWNTANVIDFLENSPPSHFDGFSLSDIASYMSRESFERLLQAIYRSAKPGARFSMRQFMSDHTIPHPVAPRFVRNHALEKNLEQEECCFVYRFMVGTIDKG
jgi:S-adenosylmethionine-diacylglycerol 3-amino-3-carboxypropyl transferase